VLCSILDRYVDYGGILTVHLKWRVRVLLRRRCSIVCHGEDDR
jgi:hypothetical protein